MFNQTEAEFASFQNERTFVYANNLYDNAMCQPTSTGYFKFVSPKEVVGFDILKILVSTLKQITRTR